MSEPTIRYSTAADPGHWDVARLDPDVSLQCPEPIRAMHVVDDHLYLFTAHGVYRVPPRPPTFPRVIAWRWRIKGWLLARLDRLAAWIRWRW